MHHVNKVSNDDNPSLDEKEDLFAPLDVAASSHISGGHWHSYSSFPSPPRRLHSYGYGRLPTSSHQLAAQRLNQALFA